MYVYVCTTFVCMSVHVVCMYLRACLRDVVSDTAPASHLVRLPVVVVVRARVILDLCQHKELMG